MVFSPFVSGKTNVAKQPLAQFMPPLPEGMLTDWIGDKIPHGGWILDPFGSSPEMVLTLARAGWHVLVTVNNPISAFLIEQLADFPTHEEAHEILARLTTSTFNDQTIKSLIRSYYQVICTQCGLPMEVSSFLWRKEAAYPYGFLGLCPNCERSGEQLLTPETKASLQPTPTYEFHLARALERIVSVDDPQREQVEAALNCYPARAIVILQTLMLKLSMLSLTKRQLTTLQSLLISVFDKSNTLWSYPPIATRRRQLSIPPVYREDNIWFSLINAVDDWSGGHAPVSCKIWPEQPPLSGGVSLFRGKLREVEPLPASDMLDGVVTIPPRPNQAFWALSAVWAGWLWGKQAVLPIKNALSRQRYDWNWHTNALRSSLQPLDAILDSGKPLYQLILENESSFLSAVLYASCSAGYELQSLSLSGQHLIVQSIWAAGPEPIEEPNLQEYQEIGREAAIQHLKDAAEPRNYDTLQASILVALSQKSFLGNAKDKKLELPLTETFRQIEAILLDSEYFTRFGNSTSSIEVGYYGLADPQRLEAESLSDRVEQKIVEILQQPGLHTYAAIQAAVNSEYTGLLTPSDDLIVAILNSYGQQDPGQSDIWTLKPSETINCRRGDIEEIRTKCIKIGSTLQFMVAEDGNKILWIADDPAYSQTLYITDSANFSAICKQRTLLGNQVIITPGSRANLLAFKQKHNPYLNQMIEDHFSIVKFRQLRSISENPLLTRELWQMLIKEDPPEWIATQMALL